MASLPSTMEISLPVPKVHSPDELFPNTIANERPLTERDVELLQAAEMEAGEQGDNHVLRDVFDGMANNGKITLDQLPFVLVGADVPATAKEIEDAIDQHLPDADDADALLDFQQVEGLYEQLMHNKADVSLEMNNLERQQPSSIWMCLKQWYLLKKQQRAVSRTAYEKHMKPTTRLLLIILCTSCVIACAIVSVAIVLIWDYSTQLVQTHAMRQAEMMKHGMQLLGYQKLVQRHQADNKYMASMMGRIVEELGYKGTKQTFQKDLVFQENLISSMMDGWYEHDVTLRASTTCMLLKGMLELMIQSHNASAAVQFVDSMNPTLPAGHEIVLSRMNQTSGAPQFLTAWRYRSSCLNGVCGQDPFAAEPTKAALSGKTGTLFGNDYRPAPVVAAHTYLLESQIGLVYKIDRAALQTDFESSASDVINKVNAAIQTQALTSNFSTRGHEVVIANKVRGKTQILTTLRGCDATCLASAGIQSSKLTDALNNVSDVDDVIDFTGRPAVMAYGPLPLSQLGVGVKVALSRFIATLSTGLNRSLSIANSRLPDTLEIQLATVVNTTNTTDNATDSSDNDADMSGTLTFQSPFKFSRNCHTDCDTRSSNTSLFLWQAIDACTEGVMGGLDYRNETVIAGFSCVPSLNAGLAIKVDQKQIVEEGIQLSAKIAIYQNNVRYANSSTEFVIARKQPGVDIIRSTRDFIRLTPLKHISQCPNMTCIGSSVHITRALRKETGIVKGQDYRATQVLGAYTYLDSLDVGLAVKVDAPEAERSSVFLALQLTGCSVSAVILSMAILALVTSRLLKSMDQAWEEGRRAVQQEKDQFTAVIQAMYPAQVAKRLLTGETQIFYHISNATIFFSDIYEFTTASNCISPEQLIRFMGYTFGTMDAVADYFRIYKVKTIGDAYLALAGLPGSESVTGNFTLDMLLFADCCAQFFSTRYIHPEDGAEALSLMTKALFTKKKTVRVREAPEIQKPHNAVSCTNMASAAVNVCEGEDEDSVSYAQCIMRYGVAAGPIAAGVLHGKAPLFDIWGKTVNLASRLESTGQPGRIQVSEAVYQAVIRQAGQPFIFDARHKVQCKGFGNVSAYFVNSCTQTPPKELLVRQNIEPNLGKFYFDNAVVPVRTHSKGSGSGQGSIHGSSSSHDDRSSRSSVASGVRFHKGAVVPV